MVAAGVVVAGVAADPGSDVVSVEPIFFCGVSGVRGGKATTVE